MKTYRKYIRYLQVLNLLTFAVILFTVLYSGALIYKLPDRFVITESLTQSKAVWISKSKIWEDIKLMVTCYLVVSVICIYLRLMPFKNGSAKHEILMASLVNLGICLIFAVTIINSLQGAS
ncbi:hypothetical protein [Dyadobacter sp. LHD-138]|uniref:hypothetical protein n=1 Tax=Dyadobacter sp. LHD-138 TaxID=3071413 RepID=UPI0027E204BE|nr:hypothetical protein [Dyadobacter sp. LHD-138]MDQ6482546.1 hypothetical protein [Dyadobacter sp. LHD-138]